MKQLHIPEILLADDDSDDCLLFKDALDEFQGPTNLTTVRDGEQLMDYLKKVKYLPDALFLDLNMPRKNGYECLTEIKHNAKLKGLPIVVISTSFDPDIVELVRLGGAQHYICKPGDYSEFVKVTHHAIDIITKRRTVDQPDESKIEDFVLSPAILER